MTLNLPLSFIGGWLYRLGGKAGLNTRIRDFGVPLLMAFSIPNFDLLTLVLSVGATFGVLTLGYGEDSFLFKYFEKKTFYVLGFLFGFALLPYALIKGALVPFVIRTSFLTLAIHYIHIYRDQCSRWFLGDASDFEEFARGFVIIASTGAFLL